MSIEHYENFPVASWLSPPALRAPITAIYHFARCADDIADEGDAPTEQRLQDLSDYRQELRRVASGAAAAPRWAAIFDPLRSLIPAYRLPTAPLEDLLDAFEQDLRKSRYADREELLDYCRRSANPVGRLLLHLYGVDDPRALRQSDAICTSLQLINFWQDMSIDGPRGRVYAPAQDLALHGLSADTVAACQDSPAARALLRDLCGWARKLMEEGAPLVHRLPGRAGWELRLVVQGGLRILAKIESMDHASLLQRPRITALDLLPMLWRALLMRPSADGRERS